MNLNIENKSRMIIAGFILVLAVLYVVASLFDSVNLLQWFAVVFGFFLSLILFVEAGVITYFKKKEYRKLGFGDVLVWFTIIIAVATFLDTLLLAGVITKGASQWLSTYVSNSATIIGASAGVLAIIHLVSPRFK